MMMALLLPLKPENFNWVSTTLLTYMARIKTVSESRRHQVHRTDVALTHENLLDFLMPPFLQLKMVTDP